MFFQFKDKFPHLIQHWDTYIGMHKRIEVPARTVLLHEGEISKRSFVVEKGCLRVWFNNNGKDTTFQFFFEGEGLASLESFRKNIPGMFTIETAPQGQVLINRSKDRSLTTTLIRTDKDTGKFYIVHPRWGFSEARLFASIDDLTKAVIKEVGLVRLVERTNL